MACSTRATHEAISARTGASGRGSGVRFVPARAFRLANGPAARGIRDLLAAAALPLISIPR